MPSRVEELLVSATCQQHGSDVLLFTASFEWVPFKDVWAVHCEFKFSPLPSKPGGSLTASLGGSSGRAQHNVILVDLDLADHVGVGHAAEEPTLELKSALNYLVTVFHPHLRF